MIVERNEKNTSNATAFFPSFSIKLFTLRGDVFVAVLCVTHSITSLCVYVRQCAANLD